MKWVTSTILLVTLYIPIGIFMLYILQDLIKVSSRKKARVHKRTVQSPSYVYKNKRNIYIAK